MAGSEKMRQGRNSSNCGSLEFSPAGELGGDRAEQGLANCTSEGQSEYFRLWEIHSICHNDSILPLERKSSPI